MRIITILLLLLPGVLLANDTFVAANEAYTRGEYETAITLYEKLLNKKATATAHFNLANTYYQTEQYGNAILQYLKAQALSPGDPDVAENLALTRRTVDIAEEPTVHLLARLAHLYNANIWAVTLVIGFWTFWALLLLPKIYNLSIPYTKTLLTTLVLACITSATALTYYHFSKDIGVTIIADAPLRVAPSDTSPRVYTIPEGTSAFIETKHEDFYFIALDDDTEGWVQDTHFKTVWNL